MELETELADLDLRRQKIRLNGAVRNDHDTARELLELELQEAMKRLEGAEAKLERLSKLVKAKQVPETELAKTEFEVRHLAMDVRRKKLKLKLIPDAH